MKISFECDYNNGAHPRVMEHLMATNDKQSLTYGFDEWSVSAKEKIRLACGLPHADIYFISGGTQANLVVIDSMLMSCEAVITAETGHINVHEAGAIEGSGHRVIALPAHDGKLSAEDLKSYMERYENDESRDHLAQPGMVYITFPTEYGTIYQAEEINAIYQLCRRYRLHLFVDGARLGYGLMSDACDISLPWLARHCDAFYIGGTKVGALCGEAVVFTHENTPRHIFSNIKRHGALLAKGRLTGIQFEALFTDRLYFDISRHAINMANKLKLILKETGFELFIDSPTNQQFAIIPNEMMKKLEKKVIFTHWEPYDNNHFVCRFVTSWATTTKDLDTLKRILQQCKTGK